MNWDQFRSTRVVALWGLLLLSLYANAQTDPLPSWNGGAAKKAIVDKRDESQPKELNDEVSLIDGGHGRRAG